VATSHLETHDGDRLAPLFNYGWVTLLVMVLIVATGVIHQETARPEEAVDL